jgi:hypothetical protein
VNAIAVTGGADGGNRGVVAGEVTHELWPPLSDAAGAELVH